jgi:hypothetical protein
LIIVFIPILSLVFLYSCHQAAHSVIDAGFADGAGQHLAQFFQRRFGMQHPQPADLLQGLGQAA